jgi:glycosyltransferase involved in cell wall biosynthesis
MNDFITRDEMMAIPADETRDAQNEAMQPVVSVLMLAFNHERYIRDALEGVMMQRCRFDFELLVGEDASTDSTRAICIEYQRKYPLTIRLVTADRNVGMHDNFFRLLGRARGRHIALCEGDDYWTAPDKLELQVAYLEENPSCAFVFHNAAIRSGSEKQLSGQILRHGPAAVSIRTIVEKDWFVPTASMVFNNRHLSPFPAQARNYPSADLATQILLAANGTVHYIPRIMSVYRRIETGVTQKISSTPKNKLDYAESFIAMLRSLNVALGYKYHAAFESRIGRTLRWMDYVRLRYLRVITLRTMANTSLYLIESLSRVRKVA